MAPLKFVDRIPFLAEGAHGGRFLATTSFYDDGVWSIYSWDPDRRKYFAMRASPAEAYYFAKAPEHPDDVGWQFLTFMAQRANRLGLERLLQGVQDDLHNLAASLEKLRLIRQAAIRGVGKGRLVGTEIEYILLVCRSLFDLLQEILVKTWEAVALVDPAAKKKALKKSFSDMVLSDNRLRSAEAIAERFALPAELAACYARHGPIFARIRQFRDRLVHGGSRVQTIYMVEEQLLIEKRLGDFLDLDIWRPEEEGPNGLAPLMPVLGLLIHGTMAACDDFAQTLFLMVRFPEPIVPNMQVYMRGFFNDALVEALADAEARVAEGKSLAPR